MGEKKNNGKTCKTPIYILTKNTSHVSYLFYSIRDFVKPKRDTTKI